MKSLRTLCGILATAALGATVLSWFVWGPLGVLAYVHGMLNARWGLGTLLLFLLVPAGVVCLPILVIRAVSRWRGPNPRQGRLYLLATIIVLAFLSSFGLEFTGLTPVPFDLFVCGLARYVDRRADIGAIQSWLGTLDPNDCEDQPLEVRIALGADISRAPKYVPVPPSLARLGWHNKRLTRDDEGRPMIRITLGGGGFNGCWGLDVGAPDMPMPPSDSCLQYYPLAPGAYIWSAE
ncbi:MAG: hypothetical protein ABFE13_09940 [Phycisphaerales bacterium]